MNLLSAKTVAHSTAPPSSTICVQNATSNITRDNHVVAEKIQPPVQPEKFAEPILAEVVIEAEKPAPVICQVDKGKCWSCTKKTGLLGYDCKCGFVFCKKHRLPETHACEFDYISHGKQVLAMNNPVIKTEKLERI